MHQRGTTPRLRTFIEVILYLYTSVDTTTASHPPLSYIYSKLRTAILTFNRSPALHNLLPLPHQLPQIPITADIYLPANHSLLSLVKNTTVCPASSGVSTNTACRSLDMPSARSVGTPPGWSA